MSNDTKYKPMNSAQLTKVVSELQEQLEELQAKLDETNKEIADMPKTETDTKQIAPVPKFDNKVHLQLRQNATSGIGPATIIACKNCKNSWLLEIPLRQYSADQPQPPNRPVHAIGATAGRIDMAHVLYCPICASVILPYDPFSELIDGFEWDEFVEDIRTSVNNIFGSVSNLQTQRPRSRARRGDRYLRSNDLEIY